MFWEMAKGIICLQFDAVYRIANKVHHGMVDMQEFVSLTISGKC
jgi:hypothetical protein